MLTSSAARARSAGTRLSCGWLAPPAQISQRNNRMPLVRQISVRRRLQILVGLLLAGVFFAEFEFGDDHPPVLSAGAPVVLARDITPADPFERLIHTNPLAA